jgi:rod shape determining protein RodA
MFLIDRRSFTYFDWISFISIILLSAIGLFFVYSATYKPTMPYSLFFKKQCIGVITGFILYGICSTIDFRSLMRWGYFCYFGVIGLLIFTMIKGSIGMGAQRWLDLGLVKIQPSELAKLVLPAYITYYLYTENEAFSYSLSQFIPLISTLFISFILILKQPDLGTALIVLFSGITLFWVAGLPKKIFLIGITCLLITAPLSWKVLKPYQKKRVLVFLGQGDSQKERYQIEQSQIAIGSGGLWGKGYLKGTQNKLSFLPEGRTDFIFSVICEEIGLIGASLILLLFLLLFLHLLYLCWTIPSPFAQLLAIGLIMPMLLSATINVGMTLGLLPIVGIPLPLISYGVSNLWITFASLGWINGIALKRFSLGT